MATREQGEPIQNPEEIKDENNGEGQKPAQGFDLYETLGVPQNASPENMKKAIGEFNNDYHKEKGRTRTKEEIIEYYKKNEAYDILSSPEERTEYDNELKEELQRAQGKFENIKQELLNTIEAVKEKYKDKTFKKDTSFTVGEREVKIPVNKNISEYFSENYLALFESSIKRYEEIIENNQSGETEEKINLFSGYGKSLSENQIFLGGLMEKIDDALESQKTEKELKNTFDAENPKSVAPETPPEATIPPATETGVAAGAEPAAEPVEPTPAEAGDGGEPPVDGPPPPPEGPPAPPTEPPERGGGEGGGDGRRTREAEKRPGWFKRAARGTGRFAGEASVAALYGAGKLTGKLVKIWYSISVLPIILLDTWDKPEKAFDEWWKFYKKLGEKEGKKASE